MLISAQEAKTIVDRFVEPLDEEALCLLVRISAEFGEGIINPRLLKRANDCWEKHWQP